MVSIYIEGITTTEYHKMIKDNGKVFGSLFSVWNSSVQSHLHRPGSETSKVCMLTCFFLAFGQKVFCSEKSFLQSSFSRQTYLLEKWSFKIKKCSKKWLLVQNIKLFQEKTIQRNNKLTLEYCSPVLSSSFSVQILCIAHQGEPSTQEEIWQQRSRDRTKL